MISPFVAAAPTSSRLRRRRATRQDDEHVAGRGQVRQRSEGGAELVFTSSMGNEFSLERDGWNNGAFAKAVVRGGAPGGSSLMISDFEGYASRRAKELTAGNQRPMMAMLGTVEDFPIAERLA